MCLKIAVLALMTFLCVPYCFAENDCPPMPAAVTQVNRDFHSGITGSIASLGKVKAGEVAIKTEVTAKTLFQKYPNVDRLVTLQTMAATYCNFLRDSPTLKDKEKLNRWERFQEKVLNLQGSTKPKESKRQKPISHTQPFGKMARGATDRTESIKSNDRNIIISKIDKSLESAKEIKKMDLTDNATFEKYNSWVIHTISIIKFVDRKCNTTYENEFINSTKLERSDYPLLRNKLSVGVIWLEAIKNSI